MNGVLYLIGLYATLVKCLIETDCVRGYLRNSIDLYANLEH